jgi:hypothetical protein
MGAMETIYAMTHDPGGKVSLQLSDGVSGDAAFGGDNDCYRYCLTRTWDINKKIALFVMMNPSTASPLVDDPTIAKVTRMVKKWDNGGYGTLLVGNTFAYRATDQNRLLEVADPIGPDNDKYLKEMAELSSMVVFAYGTPKHKSLRPRGLQVFHMMKEAGVAPYILRLSKNGIPYHPLYLPEATIPELWKLKDAD